VSFFSNGEADAT